VSEGYNEKSDMTPFDERVSRLPFGILRQSSAVYGLKEVKKPRGSCKSLSEQDQGILLNSSF